MLLKEFKTKKIAKSVKKSLRQDDDGAAAQNSADED